VADLHVSLDTPLPAALAVGTGTALFVGGWCVSPVGRIRSLSFVVNGDEQPVTAHGMPRLDVFRALHPSLDPFALGELDSDPDSDDDPLLTGYRSGFWGMVRILPGTGERSYELRLTAELEGGGKVSAELARIALATPPDRASPPAPAPEAGAQVAICMATFEPEAEMFRRQIDSIRAQTHRNWICVISDDCSEPRAFARIREVVADDRRFVISRSERRLGFYHNFERALAMAPRSASHVAMADQDDVWYPEKLETLLGELGNAQLVYSDARIIDGRGEVISDTYWSRRANNHSDLLSLLVANAVTGAASLFPAELLETALPFPPAQFAHFHDHWIALTALAMGEIAFVDRALYDYVQHGGATLGHAAATRMTGLRTRLRLPLRHPRERIRLWRMHYFVDACRLLQFATILELRCGDRMAPAKRATLERFVRADRSPLPLARLGLRGARELAASRPETLGAEWLLLHAFAWRRLLEATVRDRPSQRLRLDAVPPPALDPKPGARNPGDPRALTLVEKTAPLKLSVRENAPQRVNLLIPTIDLRHFFGGYIGKLNLARRLAQRGLRVRIVTVDPVGPLPRDWRSSIESYSGLTGLFEHVEVVFGREAAGLEVSRSDRFIATTWWTAHIAKDALRSLDSERFLYLIQEYEPFTFPMGTFAALADESYRFPHFALFSTELLRGYFRRHGLGVYAGGEQAGDASSAAFQNAITPIPPPSAADLAGRATRRLLFYARPEPHAARNMFELGVIALARALERGEFGDGWELHGIGTVDSRRSLDLGGDVKLDLLPRSAQADYAGVLREHDVGLALMYTPHPSLVPIEMAAAGMLTVTNSFENKTPEALAAISSNLITAEPSVEAVAAALGAAAAASSDFERRERGSAVAWSSDWNASFDDALLARLGAFLDA
jgi:hypothetical protein